MGPRVIAFDWGTGL